MMWNLWHQKLDIRRRYRLLGAVRILLCAVLGMSMLGLCLTQGFACYTARADRHGVSRGLLVPTTILATIGCAPARSRAPSAC